MAALTIEQLTALRDAYYNAELALLAGGQEYSVNGLRFVRAQLPEIQDERKRLDAQVAEADTSNGGSATNLATFGNG